MNKLTLLIGLLLLSVSGFSQPIGVMTFNIRLNVASDSANAWPNRKAFAASQILFHDAQLVGVQEALFDQMLDLQAALPGYKYVGVGRDDGKEKGEFSAIFYDSARFKALKQGTFWLSLTPTVPGSKSWDAAITRIVSWAYFQDLKTKKKFWMFNTHFDHIGKIARANSARLLMEEVQRMAGKEQVIVTGDFNATVNDEPIQIIEQAAPPLKLINTLYVTKTPHYGPSGTFNGFKSAELSDFAIDHIYLKNGGTVLKHATLSQTWKGRFSSDHFPVYALIKL